jgi:hypothetical protein
MTLRWAADVDRDAVLALGVAEEAAWFGDPELSAEEVGEWIDGEGGVALGVVAVDGGRIRGFASPGRLEAVFLADPARGEVVADELLTWLVQQRDVVEVMTFAGDTPRLAAFERHGLRHRMLVCDRQRSVCPVGAGHEPGGRGVGGCRSGSLGLLPIRTDRSRRSRSGVAAVDLASSWPGFALSQIGSAGDPYAGCLPARDGLTENRK